ncbi:hypothetical protein L915_21104, partial [Phytophthora nicotianae]
VLYPSDRSVASEATDSVISGSRKARPQISRRSRLLVSIIDTADKTSRPENPSAISISKRPLPRVLLLLWFIVVLVTRRHLALRLDKSRASRLALIPAKLANTAVDKLQLHLRRWIDFYQPTNP